MSLIGEAFENFVIIDKKSVSDGEGGFVWEYIEGARIKVALGDKASSLSKIAEAITERKEYNVVTPKNTILESNTIIKRLRDNTTFKILYDNENKTPESANLKLRQTTAIEWSLPR